MASVALAIALFSTGARAQNLGVEQSVPANSQMLLEANQLIYNDDAQTVTATGGVQIEYGGNHLVSDKVVYNRKTGRLLAVGRVEIVQQDGTKFYSDQIDVTDDFGDGFVNSLQVVTTDKTYFGAESAERQSGILTKFHNGIYTACEPCEQKPDKAPVWRIKSKTIIWNGKTKMIRFESPRFEMFGFPIAYAPAFEVPDPTVKRKSGFLMPGVLYQSKLGYGATIPYYFALSPTYDLTVSGSYYSEQGFLGEAEWRQRFNNGQYRLKIAGIDQGGADRFDAGTVDRAQDGFRGMVGTKGDFTLNPRWNFGWNALLQSDKDFSYIYKIGGYSSYVFRNEIYLTGLNDRNYFDLRAMKFSVQENVLNSSTAARDAKQPWILPSLDYSYTPDEPVAGGELNFDLSERIVHRSDLDAAFDGPVIRGVEGTDSRLTGEAEWRRTFITDGGLVITPLLHVQADAAYNDISAATQASVQQMAQMLNVGADVRSELYRYMATAGLETRWPVLFSTTSSTHILEPVAQLFVRPDEPYADKLVVVNEDAQSFVFDATTLFDRDKFSGYDRIEGGTRANVGMRYSGSYDNGWTTNAIVGQSYQLAGRNSFASPDLVNVGAYSGLENNVSDYVGLVGFGTPFGLSASLSTRLGRESLDARRTEARAAYSNPNFSVYGKYAFIAAQPLYGLNVNQEEVSGGASAKVGEYWRLFTSATFDIRNSVMLSRSVGFSYNDECFGYLMTLSQSRNRLTGETTQTVGFNISFRTLGDIGSNGAL